MLILDTMSDITFYRIGLILKTIGNIVFIVVPIMIMLFCTADIIKIVFQPDEAKTQIKTIVDRIIAGLIIFILPTIINYAFTLVESYDKNTILKYYEGASQEKLASLELQYQAEQKAELNLKEAELKEATRLNEEQEKKKREAQEELFNEYKESKQNNSTNNNSNTSETTYSGDTTSSGNYGSVTVNNGVFTIPNKRATSDADIPKQSGEYGLNPIFWERLNKFIQDGEKAGHKIRVSNGWRSYSSQRKLWDTSSRPCSTRSKWVACPGGSRHGFGIAADLKFNGSGCAKGTWNCNAAAKWAHENVAKYGLKFRMSWEPWHIEPAQVNGGKFGSCQAKC